MREVMRERGDLFFAQGISHVGHRCSAPAGSLARLVVMQRLDQIFLALAGQAANRLGSPIRISVTRCTAPSRGSLCALTREIGVIVGCGWCGRCQRGKVGAESANVLVADWLDDRLRLL